MAPKATTLGGLRKDIEAGRVARRSVKSEVRDNLIRKLRAGEPLFPGIIGYDDSSCRRSNAVLAPQLHPARPARPGQDAPACAR
jgi:magnesium chelatase subunit I